MTITLDKHQVQAVNFILKHKKAALFMGVGTGKTFTALEIFNRVNPKNCLIITTAKLIKEKQWEDETLLYLDHLPDNIEFISHQKLTRNYKQYIFKQYDMIVIDEAHKIKSTAKQRGGTKITRLLLSMARRASYVVPMTGTPVGNDFIDVFNIFRNCDINMWNGWTESDFIETYYYYFKKDWSGAGFKVTMPLGLKNNHKEDLWRLIREKAFVVKTEEVLNIPSKKFKTFYIEGLNNEKIYEKLEDKIIKYKDFEDTLIELKRRNFKHQAAQGFIYEETEDKTPYQFSNKKIDEFARKIPTILDKLGKTVIVYWFRQDKHNIVTKLDSLNISHTTSKKEFEKSADVFLLHFLDSEGLNLQTISRSMVFYSYVMSYMNFSQLTGRIWRRGQEKTCYYFIFISKNTIEEDYWKGIKKKKEKDDFVKEAYCENF